MKVMKTSNTAPNGEAVGSKAPLSRRVAYFVAFGLIVAAIIVITAFLVIQNIEGNLGSGTRHEASAAREGIAVRRFAAIDEDRAFPYGIAPAPDGNFYLSLFGKGIIQKIAPDGKLSTLTVQSAPGALAATADGTLYFIDYSAPARDKYGTLKRWTPANDKVSLFGGPAVNDQRIGLFAQLAVDKAGNVYLSRAETAQIWRIAPDGSTAQLWWSVPSSAGLKAQPIGIAIDAVHNGLVVVDAGTGSIYRVELASDRPNGTLLYQQVDTGNPATTIEGSLTTAVVDAQGRVLIASWKNDVGILSRLELDGGSITRLAVNFRAPLGMVYQNGNIYVVNSDLPGLVEQIKTTKPYTVDVVELGAK